ncbi:MAG: TraB/GumN family protein [Ignavibacteriales bacterium]|nr:TraB/GumN family protein [Ignavibacteriales bacterium]
MKKLVILFILIFSYSNVASQDSTSLLWKITSPENDLVSYLYGTIHVRDKRVFEFVDFLKVKILSCDAYASEILLDDTSNLRNKIDFYTAVDSTKGLSKIYTNEEYNRIALRYNEILGSDLKKMEYVKPHVVSAFLIGKLFRQKNKEILDSYLYNFAKDNGRKLYGLENLEEHNNTYLEYYVGNDSMQAARLLILIDNFYLIRKQTDKMLNYYKDNSLDSMIVSFNDNLENKNIQENSDIIEIFDVITVERNKKIAMSISIIIVNESLFCAIGVGHLVGEGNVVELLREKGFILEPIQLKINKKPKKAQESE